MAYSTVVAYAVLLLLTPVPNVAINSYINRKPVLTKVSAVMVINFPFISIRIAYLGVVYYIIV